MSIVPHSVRLHYRGRPRGGWDPVTRTIAADSVPDNGPVPWRDSARVAVMMAKAKIAEEGLELAAARLDVIASDGTRLYHETMEID